MARPHAAVGTIWTLIFSLATVLVDEKPTETPATTTYSL